MKKKKRVHKYIGIVKALHARRYYPRAFDDFDEVFNGVWYYKGVPIARRLKNECVQVNWQEPAEFRWIVVYRRFRALSLFYGVPIPLMEKGWVTIRIGKPVKPVSAIEAPKLARQLFYAESGANVSERVFVEVLTEIKKGTSKETWLQKNSKQSLLWEVCRKIKIIKKS